MSEGPELTLLLPALNEAQSLKTLLPAIKAQLGAMGVTHELLLVDGGSSDGTADLARGQGCRVISQTGRGFGAAVREGLAAARGAYILEMDADGSHPVESLPRLWEARGRADLVVASRYMAGGSADLDLVRRFLSRLLNFVSRCWLGWDVRDASSGLRIYRAAAVQGLTLEASDFTIQQETLAGVLKGGGAAAEIPFHFGLRFGGRSKARVIPLAFSYLGMLWRLKVLFEGPEALTGLGAVLLLGLATGLCGITWGLPGPARLRAFPERLKPTPEIAKNFADSWTKLYQDIERSHEELQKEEPVTYVKGVEEYPPGWDFPPGKLANAYRSLLLQSENPDEKKNFIILGQMRPWRLEFKPLYIAYGGAYIYPLGACLAAASLTGAFRLTSDLSYFLLNPQAMGRAYLTGRLFILFFHLGALWVLFDLGKKLSGWKTGALAGAFFALAPVIVINEHVLKPYGYSAFFCLLAVRSILAIWEAGRKRDYALFTLALGWASGANVACIFFAVMPVLAYLARRRRLAAGPSEWRWALAAAAGVALLWLLTNPFLVLAPHHFAWETTVFVPLVPGLDFGRLALLLSSNIPAGLGWPLWVLAVAGFAFWTVRGDSVRPTLAVSCVIVFLLLWGKFSYAGVGPGVVRLYYPLVALACLAAADFLAAGPAPRWAKGVIAAAVLADVALRGGVCLANMRADAGPDSTRYEAARWIEANVPAGASVGLTRYFEPAHAPYLRYDLYHLVIFQSADRLDPKRLPDWIVVDQEGFDEIDTWSQKNYHEARAFFPTRAGWARVVDDTLNANAGFHILRRDGPSGS